MDDALDLRLLPMDFYVSMYPFSFYHMPPCAIRRLHDAL